jgi:hypothetical protein
MKQIKVLTLDGVKQQFEDWRAQKCHSDKIPEALWDLVRELIDIYHYKRTVVGHTLGISAKQLNKKIGTMLSNSPSKHPSSEKPQFVQASLSTLTKSPSSPAIKIEKSDGMTLSLMPLSDAQFSQLLNHFIG